MISVSSELGLGFGGLEEDMILEESDFEEESTHSYVSCVDPDVALSYIDEKLENVLGHFQKDFEGGVSAENLGAKYGGYGSFLSMYQRSPACARPKSPPEVQNRTVGRSIPEVSVSGSTSKAPASDVLGKLKKFVKSSNIESKQKPVTKNSSSSAPTNPKTLRLRIKVGSSDISSLKNVCKQGLDMPLSTSRVNGHSDVEEGLLYGIHDSPTKIIMAMVSFPFHKDQLLSPLSDDLMQFGKKEMSMKDYVSVNKGKEDILGVSDAQKRAGKETLKERVKYRPQSNRRDKNHIFVSNTEKDADEKSCEELVSKTLKLPLLSCLSPSYIHPAKEIDQISDSKPELEDNVAAFPDPSVKETESVDTRKEGERRVSLESKSKREKVPCFEHVDKISQSETRNEEQVSKSKRPKAHMSQKSSGSIVASDILKGKDAVVNTINTNVPEKLQEDIGGSKDVYDGFFGDSAESKEKKQSSPVLNSKKEKVSEENASKESVNSVKKDEEACIKSYDRHNTKESVTWEVKEKHYDEGEMENLGVEPERELSGTSKKPKTGRSRFSAVDQPRSNKILDVDNKTMITQVSAQKVKDIGTVSSHDRHEDRKRKQKESKESEETDRKKKRLNGSSCDSERAVSQENGKYSAPHLPFTASCPSLLEEPVAPSELRVLDPPELKSGRISENHNADSNGGDRLKRCRDGKGYSTIDKPGTRKKAAEISKDDNLLIRGQATHSWDKERAYSENCSIENYKKSKKSERYSGENGTAGESQRKNKEGDRGMVNEVQDLGTGVEVKTKESRSKKRPMESSKEDSREYQDHSTKLDRNRGKGNHVEVTAEKLKSKAPPSDTDQVTKKQIIRNNNHSVTHDVGSRNQKENGSRHKDQVGVSPLKKESQSQAAFNLIKEAADLKHMADRLQEDGSDHERTGVYFQAALKFLLGASLLDSNSGSRQVYGRTANLCEFCAHEYEKQKDMGAAALAYKCMEVAYLRITYSSHGNINRYRQDLQAALQENPSGESPSLASDGENSNHTLATEKAALSNTVGSSPSVTGNHVVSSGKNSSLSQLLAFSQGISFAMDASRKAQIAFAAAKGKSSDSRYSSDGITCIKRALNFNFQDMEKLLHVVRLAMESINR